MKKLNTMKGKSRRLSLNREADEAAKKRKKLIWTTFLSPLKNQQMYHTV